MTLPFWRRAIEQVCFRLQDTLVAEALVPPGDQAPLELGSAQAEALTELLQVFACGEESAALAFAHLAGTQAEAVTQTALTVIAEEESVHEVLLRRLRHGLPAPRTDPSLRRSLIRFYGGLRFEDAGQHLAGIAALDSGVCAVVGALLRPGSPLAGVRRAAEVFARIHREEAGHVRLSRVLARDLVGSAPALAVAARVREDLVSVLALRGAAFGVLGVDADALFAQLRRPSRALFA